MFLATTALTDFWDKDDEILFLGTECLRHDRRSDWEDLRYQLLPCPWDDRQRFRSAAAYVSECWERMLTRLTEYLNEVHHTSLSQRYYRILLGQWLQYYIHHLYERYVRITEAFDSYPRLRTVLLDPQDYRVPRRFTEFAVASVAAQYNLQMCSEVIELLGYDFPRGRLEWSVLNSGEPSVQELFMLRRRASYLPLWRKIGRWAWQGLLNGAQARAEVGLMGSDLDLKETFAVAWHSRFRMLPLFAPDDLGPAAPEFDRQRQGLGEIRAMDTFERVLAGSLPHNLPTSYLEGFDRNRELVSRYLKRGMPKGVYANRVASSRELTQFVLGEASEKGRRIIAEQHGGGYGMHQEVLAEEFETACVDSYFVWGWAEDGAPNARNVPSRKLSRQLPGHGARRRLERGDGRGILLVVTGSHRYYTQFCSGPVGSQWETYYQWTERFIRALPQQLQDELVVRVPPRAYGTVAGEWLKSHISGLCLDNTMSFSDSLRDSRMVVIDHPITTFLEAMVAGIPTVLFWDPERWDMRESAIPYLADLRQAGILWDSPEEAARKVEVIYEDPQSWWLQPEVETARARFAQRFALANPGWVRAWVAALRKEVAAAKV